jgi:hypothetical protein
MKVNKSNGLLSLAVILLGTGISWLLVIMLIKLFVPMLLIIIGSLCLVNSMMLGPS